MRGLLWTSAVWGSVAAAAFAFRHRRPSWRDWFTRENIALVLVLLGTHSVVGRSDAEEILSDPVVLERVVRGGLAGVALLLALPLAMDRIGTIGRGHRSLIALMVYLAVAAVSVLYSSAPLVTLAKVLELTAGVVAVLAVALGPDSAIRLRRAVGLLIILEAALLLVALVGFALAPATFAATQTRPGFLMRSTMVSPFAHSNALSAIGALTASFALATALEQPSRERRWWWVLFLAGTVGTILASGRQGVAIWLAATAVLLFHHRRTAFLLLVVPASAWLSLTYLDGIIEVLSRGRPQNWATFTGRSFWWEAALSAWREHPWTGYGFGAGGRFVALRSIGRGTTSSVHSGYFEALVGVGLLGVLPLLYLLGRMGRWSIQRISGRTEAAFGILVVPLVLRTAVSLGFGGWLNYEFLLFALLALMVDQWGSRAGKTDRAASRISVSV